MNDSTLWVGHYDDQIVVFDPNIQLKNCPHIFLWSVATAEMKKFLPDIFRPHVRSIQDSEVVVSALSAYRDWFSKYGELWRNEQHSFYTQQKAQEEARKKQLHTSGLYSKREPHCWSCKSPLDSTNDTKCDGCGWILCPCGACGCGYSR